MELDASDVRGAVGSRRKEEIEKRQLKEMESKLLHGVDDLELRNKMLEEAALEGAEVEDREKVPRLSALRRIAAMEEAKLLKEEKFASKKEEAADKTKKLKKMFSKYQTAKEDLEEHARRHRRREGRHDGLHTPPQAPAGAEGGAHRVVRAAGGGGERRRIARTGKRRWSSGCWNA